MTSDSIKHAVTTWFRKQAQELGAQDQTVEEWCKNQLYFTGDTVPQQTDARVYWYQKMGIHQYDIKIQEEPEEKVQEEPEVAQVVGEKVTHATHGVFADMEPVGEEELRQLCESTQWD